MSSTLKEILIRRIKTSGPITVADYMRECLVHPKYGYYQNEAVFGADGDFITAPEISQMFGEIIGAWLIQEWQRLGSPDHVNLIELGPGRGTLMQDIRRVMASIPALHSGASVHFVETSAQLRAQQKEKHPNAVWHDSIASIPSAPCLIVANEFFDALPIHQFLYTDKKWLERVIAADDKDGLHYASHAPGPILALLMKMIKEPKAETLYEVSPQSITAVGDITKLIADNSGAAVIIDYGYPASEGGDTFQALKDHRYVDPLAEPGLADLTAHVAFDQLRLAAKPFGVQIAPLETQGNFLMQHSIGIRAQRLAHGQGQKQQEIILSELKRLTSPDEMGDLFKVMVIRK